MRTLQEANAALCAVVVSGLRNEGEMMMHREAIEHAKEQARRAGNRDYIDVYWYALNGRWPTLREWIIILSAGVHVGIPPGIRQEFPLKSDAPHPDNKKD